jgi:uncharacterized protein
MQSARRPKLKSPWTRAQARALRDALPAKPSVSGTLSYCQLAGFLFAVACAPAPILPTRWLRIALGEDGNAFTHDGEAQRVIELVVALYNHVNDQVREGHVQWPALVEPRPDPADNIGPDAPLGQWALGVALAQLSFKPMWDEAIGALRREDARDVEDTLRSVQTVFLFFLERGRAEEFVRNDPDRPRFHDAARRMVQLLPQTMQALADVGAFLQTARGAA